MLKTEKMLVTSSFSFAYNVCYPKVNYVFSARIYMLFVDRSKYFPFGLVYFCVVWQRVKSTESELCALCVADDDILISLPHNPNFYRSSLKTLWKKGENADDDILISLPHNPNFYISSLKTLWKKGENAGNQHFLLFPQFPPPPPPEKKVNF